VLWLDGQLMFGGSIISKLTHYRPSPVPSTHIGDESHYKWLAFPFKTNTHRDTTNDVLLMSAPSNLCFSCPPLWP